MNNDNKNLNTEPATEILSMEPPKRSWWKYVAGVVGIIVFVLGGYVIWNQYFSSEAQYRREVEKSALALPAKLEAYKKTMEADTYGGKTPEETLQFFIDALKKGDIELASKYFALDDDTAIRGTIYLDGLKKANEENRIPEIIRLLSKAKRDQYSKGASDNDVWFIVEEDGKAIADPLLIFNKHSKVWKIKSL